MPVKGFLILCLFFTGPVLFAESVIMKNGTVINGQVVGQSKESIRISINGTVQTILKKDVRKISFASPESEQNTEEVTARERQKAEEERNKTEKMQKELAWQAFRSKENRIKLHHDENVWSAMHQEYRTGSDSLSDENADGNGDASGESVPYFPGKVVTRRGILLRNAILPGRGDHYAGSKLTGFMGGGTFALAAANAAYAYGNYRAARSSYNRNSGIYMALGSAGKIDFGNGADLLKFYVLQSLDTRAYTQYDKNARSFNNSLLVLETVYLGMIIHSFFLETTPSLARSEKSQSVHFTVFLQPGERRDNTRRETIVSGSLQFRF